MKIPSYDCFKFLEVFEITERRDGAIFKTKRTGKYIKAEQAPLLPKNFTAVSISTELMKQQFMELDVRNVSEFK